MKKLLVLLLVVFMATSAMAITFSNELAGKPATSTVGDSDQIPVVHLGETKLATRGTLFNGVKLNSPTFTGFANFSGSGLKTADVVAKGPWADVRHPAFAGGAKGNGTADDTAAIQAAIDSGRPVYMPAGTYIVSHLNLHSRTVIHTDGFYSTIVNVAASSAPAVVTTDAGQVKQLDIGGIWFKANPANVGQHGMVLEARDDGGGTGGVWRSSFHDLRFDGFTGYGVWFKGGANGYNFPHQFNTVERVTVFRANDTTSRPILLTGQVEHTTLINCQYDGVTKGTGTNVEISRQFTNGSVVGGSLVGGTADGDNAPIDNTFISCSFQTSDLAVSIDRATNTNFFGCWFESLYRGFLILSSSKGTVVLGNYFPNAGSDGTGGGYLLNAGAGCSATFVYNSINGTYDYAIKATNSYGVTDEPNFRLTQPLVEWSTGNTYQAAIDGTGAISADNHRSVYVSGSPTELTTINTNIGVGESVEMRALGNIRLASGGNLTIPRGKSHLTIVTGQVFRVTRADLAADLIVSPPSGVPEGPTANRPTPASDEDGFLYYDSTIGNLITWSGSGWLVWLRNNQTMQPVGSTFASLGSILTAGTMKYCTDCTTAATCTGGGSGHMAVSNGVNWTCQ